jgi:hypothetical protein
LAGVGIRANALAPGFPQPSSSPRIPIGRLAEGTGAGQVLSKFVRGKRRYRDHSL